MVDGGGEVNLGDIGQRGVDSVDFAFRVSNVLSIVGA